MGPVTITERFVAQCSPVISSNYDTCGTVTKATIAHLTATQLAALFAPGGLFADLDAWFKHSLEMRACGVKRNVFYDWIMANADREAYRAGVTGIKGVKTYSLIQPFIFGRQETVVNREYWKVTNGWSTTTYKSNNADATAYPLTDAQVDYGADTTASAAFNAPLNYGAQAVRTIRVESRHGIPMDVNWFRQRETIHIFSRRGNGAAEHGQWKVIAAASDSGKTFVDLVIVDMNSGSTEPFNATPTAGVLIPGINNVSDYEKWCQNLPTIDPRKRVPFWVQTFRTSRCVNAEYREVFAKLMETNPAFREFGDLPMAERNAQDEAEMQRRFVNEFLFNKPLPNQTVNAWESLEPINSVDGSVINVGVGGNLQGRRANFIGAMEQLRTCDRVFDLTNNALNLEEFLQLNYDIKRAREGDGKTKVMDIDWWTDSIFRARFQTAMMQYYKDQYLDQLRLTCQINAINTDLGIVYDSYHVKRPGGVRINIMSDNTFDDLRDEMAASSIENSMLLCLEIGKPGAGSIYWAQIASNRRVFTTAQIEQLAKIDTSYRCVMETTSIEQTLKSETGTVVVECPLRSAAIVGIADHDPVTTGRTVAYSNLY